MAMNLDIKDFILKKKDRKDFQIYTYICVYI